MFTVVGGLGSRFNQGHILCLLRQYYTSDTISGFVVDRVRL